MDFNIGTDYSRQKKQSTIDVVLNENRTKPGDSAVVGGPFYSFKCALDKMQGVFSATAGYDVPVGSGMKGQATVLSNMTIDMGNPEVKSFVLTSGAKQYDPNKFGSSNLVKMSDATKITELRKVLYPIITTQTTPGPSSSGVKSVVANNGMVQLIASSKNSLYLDKASIVSLSNNMLKEGQDWVDSSTLVEPKDKPKLKEKLRVNLTQELENDIFNGGCASKEGECSPALYLNPPLDSSLSKEGAQAVPANQEDAKPRPTVTLRNQALAWYTPDFTGNGRHRRPGSREFFIVEMLGYNPGFSEPVRVNVPTAEGSASISSLKLNLSPNSLTINTGKKIQRTQTLTRWVEEHWGDEMDQISFTGSTFAFLDYGYNKEGLTVAKRTDTDPYKELQHLVRIYQANGCIYQKADLNLDAIDSKDMVNEQTLDLSVFKAQERSFFNYADPSNPFTVNKHPRSGMVKSRLYVRLKSDIVENIGYFDSFDVIEDANKPFNLSFSVSFKSEQTKWL
jgi:hypothetical protein